MKIKILHLRLFVITLLIIMPTFNYKNHIGELAPHVTPFAIGPASNYRRPLARPPIFDSTTLDKSKILIAGARIKELAGKVILPAGVSSHICSFLFGDNSDSTFDIGDVEVSEVSRFWFQEVIQHGLRHRDIGMSYDCLSNADEILHSEGWQARDYRWNFHNFELGRNSHRIPFAMSFFRYFGMQTSFTRALVHTGDNVIIVSKRNCIHNTQTPCFYLIPSQNSDILSHISLCGWFHYDEDMLSSFAPTESDFKKLFLGLASTSRTSSSALTGNFHACITNSGVKEFSETVKVERVLNLPEYNLDLREDGNFSLVETSEDVDSISFSGINREYVIPRSIMKRIQHDMVLSYFCEVLDEDMSLEEFFGRMGDRVIDVPTPDILTNIASRGMITEVGTTRNPHGSQLVFDKKLNKLIDISRARELELKIIAVSQSEVTHNVDLTPEHCMNLCSRFLYGLDIRNRAVELGWEEEDDADELIVQIENEFRDFTFDKVFNDPLCSSSLDNKLIDMEYMRLLLKDAEDEFTKETTTIPDHKALINSYVDKVDKVGEIRADKATAPVCMFSLKHNANSVRPSPKYTSDLYNVFWTDLLMNNLVEEGKSYSECQNLTMEVEDEFVQRKENKKTKAERHVYDLEKNHDLDVALAQCGVQGRKYSKDIQKIQKDMDSRIPYSLDNDTSDIETFINSYREMVRPKRNPLSNRFEKLLDYADAVKHNTSITRSLLNSEIGCMLTTFTAIMCEININSRKRMKGRQWSVVKHPALPCYIAIHTSKTNSHIFYSVIFNKCDMDGYLERPFRNLINLDDDCVCTPLCSLTHHDLSMWISMPNMLLSAVTVWADVSDYDILSDGLENHPFGQEIMFVLLEALEHKESSATPTFNARYMYMEMLKPYGTICNPFKVLSKYPTVIRSKLLVFTINKLINGFESMLRIRELHGENVPKTDVTEETETVGMDDIPLSMDKVPNLISYISGNELKTFEEAVNISYIGVFHNVDKGEQLHGYLKIFSKVIKEELILRTSRIEYMSEDNKNEPRPSEYNSHEFSPNHMRNIAKVLKKHLKKKGIYRKDIRRHIFKNLSEISFSELSTFKASANCENFINDNNPDWSDYDQKRRNKALTEVINLMEEIEFLAKTPYTNLKKLFKKLEESGGIIANLFKKNQPTGVREIFVLTMISRIVIKILESISRSLCEMSENEYLTKGSRKSTASSAHFASIRSKKSEGDISMTVSDSADATTWCQRFIMNVFKCFFSEFFSEDNDIMNVINSVLNLVTTKRLELPKSLLDLFKKNFSEESFDDGMNELKRQFLGLSENTDLMEPFKILMKNRSNFMQGILHYTSSIVHSSHLLWFETLVESLFASYLGRIYGNGVYIQSKTKVSSDDASRQTTVIIRSKLSSDNKVLAMVRQFLLYTSSLLICTYPLFSAKLSREKSTTHVLTNIEEFNSEWTIVNTVVTPKIKWAYSSQVIQTTSSMSEKQNVDHGLINDLTQNGCRRQTTQVCEFGVMLNHYSTIGFYTLEENFFDELMNDIFDVKSNMGGFYYLSHHMIGTTLGFSCTKWHNLKMFKNSRLSEMVTMKSSFGVPQEDGSIDFSLTLPVGFGRNYKLFLDGLNITKESVEESLINKEHVLFGDSNSASDELIRIRCKAVGTGASKAFSFSSASKQHSVSSYINTVPCMNGRTGDRLMKYSLPAAISMIRENWDVEYVPDDISYPQKTIYESVADGCESISFIPQKRRRRKVLMKLNIPNLSRVSQIPLMKCLQKLWFNMDVNAARFQVTSSFEKYRTVFPWLDDTFSESFKNYCEIFGETSRIIFVQHLTNLSHKDRSFKFHHQGRHEAMIEKQLIDCICMNMKIGHIYIDPERSLGSKLMSADLVRHLENSESKLAELSNAPPTPLRNEMMLSCCSLPNELTTGEIDHTIRNLPTRLVPLYVMSVLNPFRDIEINEQTSSDLIYYISLANQGTIGYYKQEQSRDANGKFRGPGVILGICEGVKFRVSLFNQKIVKIKCENPTMLYAKRYEFLKFLKKLKCEPEARETGEGVFLTKSCELERNSVGLRILRGEVKINEIKDLRISLHVNAINGLSLKFRTRGMTGDTLTYYPKYQRQAEFGDIDDDIIRKWLHDERIGSHWFQEMLEDENLRSWSKETIRLRMQHKGLIKSTLPEINWMPVEEPKNEVTYDFLSLDDTLFEQSLVEIDLHDANNLEQIMENEEEIGKSVEETMQYIHMLDEDYQESQPRSFDLTKRIYIMNRVFWDEVIDSLKPFIHVGYNSMNMSEFGTQTKRFFEEIGFKDQSLAPYANPFKK